MRTTTTTNAPDNLRALHNQLEAGFSELVSSDAWARMLRVAARFHDYSPSNVLLIIRQRPEATRVAGYRTWQQIGRQVRRGERSIAILAPCTYKRGTEDDKGEPDNESPRLLRGFKIARVFDVDQTEGDPLPDIRPALLDGDAPAGLWDDLATHVATAGFTVRRGDCRPANGRTDYPARTVTVRADVSDAQATKTLAHELAHVLLHDGGEYVLGCRGLVEVEAESVAYIVATAAGLSTEAYSFPYVAHWAGGNLNAIKATAGRVITAAHAILSAIVDQPDTAGPIAS